VGQNSLAYLTAKTYNLEEEAAQLEDHIPADTLPQVNPNAKTLQPPLPAMQAESNWPLLTISKVPLRL
jgi:coatomer subunit alpha